MDFFELVKKRRSVRKFTDESVPKEVINKSLESAILAANSSNLQPWEFYWVKDDNKKQKLVEACFSQNAAKTAKELIVAVSRIDTWKRNKNFVVDDYKKRNKLLPVVDKYYNKLIPLSYFHDSLGIIGIFKKFIFMFLGIIGLFKPIPRGPIFKSDVFEIVTKTTALACQNFMMAIVAQGYDSCPMEGFDHKRVKKILNLNNKSHVVMILAVGKGDSKGVYGERFRIDNKFVIKEV